MIAGLRIDVDTFRGTKLGVPNLCSILAEHSIKATFFFTVGPDNMGRHLWRLLRPAFFLKMMRTNAGSLYGWDILFKGTFWPGPVIGKELGILIKIVSDKGNEIGLHAWDHHDWQAHLEKMNCDEIAASLKKGVEELTRICGKAPVCSAAPAWKCNDAVLLAKSKFDFRYNSDCRGQSIFYPVIDGKALPQPQIPVTLPTYDEVVGQGDISDNNYNDYTLSLFNPEKLNVLTIHAEVEGIAKLDLFRDFLKKAKTKDISFVPLQELLADSPHAGLSPIIAKEIPGREGWLAYQDKN